jgi:hypothetical protein
MVSEIVQATTSVRPDEKAWKLAEVNNLSPDGKSLRRYRHIWVFRNDRIAEYIEDLGPAKAFKGAEINIPSLGEHTVDELIDIVQYLRENPWPEDNLVKTNLVQDYYDKIDEITKWKSRASTFGSIGKVQRNY